MGILSGIVSFVLGLIVQLMDVVVSLFLETVSFDMTFFIESFPYMNSIGNTFVAVGAGLLIMGIMWSIVKYLGVIVGIEAENPVKIIVKAGLAYAVIFRMGDAIKYVVDLMQIIYDHMAGLPLSVPGGHDPGSIVLEFTAQIIAGTAGFTTLFYIIGWLILLFKFIKFMLEVVERYVAFCFLQMISPVFVATGPFKGTKAIFESWFKAFFGQGFLIIMNLWSTRMFLSCMYKFAWDNMTFDNGLLTFAIAYAFLNFASKLDSFFRILGFNTVSTGGGNIVPALLGTAAMARRAFGSASFGGFGGRGSAGAAGAAANAGGGGAAGMAGLGGMAGAAGASGAAARHSGLSAASGPVGAGARMAGRVASAFSEKMGDVAQASSNPVVKAVAGHESKTAGNFASMLGFNKMSGDIRSSITQAQQSAINSEKNMAEARSQKQFAKGVPGQNGQTMKAAAQNDFNASAVEAMKSNQKASSIAGEVAANSPEGLAKAAKGMVTDQNMIGKHSTVQTGGASLSMGTGNLRKTSVDANGNIQKVDMMDGSSMTFGEPVKSGGGTITDMQYTNSAGKSVTGKLVSKGADFDAEGMSVVSKHKDGSALFINEKDSADTAIGKNLRESLSAGAIGSRVNLTRADAAAVGNTLFNHGNSNVSGYAYSREKGKQESYISGSSFTNGGRIEYNTIRDNVISGTYHSKNNKANGIDMVHSSVAEQYKPAGATYVGKVGDNTKDGSYLVFQKSGDDSVAELFDMMPQVGDVTQYSAADTEQMYEQFKRNYANERGRGDCPV